MTRTLRIDETTMTRSAVIAACSAACSAAAPWGFCVCLLAAAAAAPAQTYPVRPIRVLVPQQAGGSVDMTARYQTAQLQSQLGQSLIVDNRPGATGIIGTQIAAMASPDGYTLLYNASNMLVTQVIYPKIPFDVLRDFIPITNSVSSLGNLLVVNPSVPARSVGELIELAKHSDAPLKYGTQGVGSGQHLLGETFNLRARTSLMHVPYKGVPAIINAAISGEVDVLFISPMTVFEHIKTGRLRALGYTGAARWPYLPELPTLSESGLRGFDNPQASWHGWFAPAKTSNALVMKIYNEVHQALQVAKVRNAIEAGGYVPGGDYPPAEFRKYIEDDLKRIAEVAHAARIKME